MKVWVTGAAGALGREVVTAAPLRGHEVLGTTHPECPIEGMVAIEATAKVFEPDCIINCAGVLPGGDVIESAVANTLGPASLALLGIRLVHMSTDCVFAGNRWGWLGPTDKPNPVDGYGRTKLAGEISAANVLNVRGSFLSQHGGLLRWLLDSTGPVDAWERAYWNGGSAAVMADALLTLAEGDAIGVIHASSPEYVSKAELVEYFVDELGLSVQPTRVSEPEVWRVLKPDYELPPVWSSMKGLVECVQRSRSS